jgi:hypothetical protein
MTTSTNTSPADEREEEAPTSQLPSIRIGVLAGLTGILCCVGPTVLAMVGIVGAGTAYAWANTLYDGYAWFFRLGGLLVLVVLVAWSLKRRDQCTLAGVRRVSDVNETLSDVSPMGRRSEDIGPRAPRQDVVRGASPRGLRRDGRERRQVVRARCGRGAGQACTGAR